MKICPHCGQPLDDDRPTCPMCNQAVSSKEPSESDNQEEKDPIKKEQILMNTVTDLVTSKRFWMITAYVIAGLLTIVWGGQAISKLLEPKSDITDTRSIEQDIRMVLDRSIDEILVEKLDWAREVMRRRLPTRFPEELILDDKRKEAEVMYDNEDKTAVHYEFQVCYHFDNDVEETFQWKPVTFYFELRDEKWELIGENWVRDSELMFE